MTGDMELVRSTAELFLRRMLRIGCSMKYSMPDAVYELNIDLKDLKQDMPLSMQADVDKIVKQQIKGNLPLTTHGLMKYLKKQIPLASMVVKLEIASSRKLG
jgi:hypothetical protein